jgi:hypothetical protein
MTTKPARVEQTSSGSRLKRIFWGAAFLLVAAVMLLPLFVSGHVVNESQLRAHCQHNLNQIMLALTMYADENAGQYPDQGLWQLAAQGYLAAGRVYQCPRVWGADGSAPLTPAQLKAGLSDYIYLGTPEGDDQPVIYEVPANHNPQNFGWCDRRMNRDVTPWINVGFADGSARGFEAEFWPELAIEQGWE